MSHPLESCEPIVSSIYFTCTEKITLYSLNSIQSGGGNCCGRFQRNLLRGYSLKLEDVLGVNVSNPSSVQQIGPTHLPLKGRQIRRIDPGWTLQEDPIDCESLCIFNSQNMLQRNARGSIPPGPCVYVLDTDTREGKRRFTGRIEFRIKCRV